MDTGIEIAPMGHNRISRRDLLFGTAAGASTTSLASLLAACTRGAATGAAPYGPPSGNFPPHPSWRFVFVNHAMDDPFFRPTLYGIQDASALLGTTYQWTGSKSGNLAETLAAVRAAVTSRADGIVLPLLDPTAFDGPVGHALDTGIPVLGYYVDVPFGSPNRRLAFLGQDPYTSGYLMGRHIVQLVGDAEVAIFISAPRSPAIQPRADGALKAIRESGKSIDAQLISSPPGPRRQLAQIDAFYRTNRTVHGMFAVDGSNTQALAQVAQRYNLAASGVHAGGYDLLPRTVQAIQVGQLAFTVDQQPYQQGYFAVQQLFLYKMSGGLMSPSTMDTGLKLVARENVGRYINTQTRYEGSSSAEKLVM